MKVKELIVELQKMPQDAEVTMWVSPDSCCNTVIWVERRYLTDVYLCDKYWTPYAEEDDE